MSMDEFDFILDKLKGYTEYIYYHLMGEPLTHPELSEFIKMAGERGYKSIITTNGTLLSKRGEELLNAGVHKINISLHSFEKESDEEHNKYIKEVVAFTKKAVNCGILVVLRLWNKGTDEGKNEKTIQLLKEEITGEWSENTRGFRISEMFYLEWGERFEWPDINAEIKGDKYF